MHKLFIVKLAEYTVRKDLLTAIAFELEHAYYEKNKDNSDKEKEFTKRLNEIRTNIDTLDKKYYIKEEMTREKFDKMASELAEHEAEILKELEDCSHSISNLNEKILQAAGLCLKLPEIWEKASFSKKESLQKLIFPEGLSYNKKTQAF